MVVDAGTLVVVGIVPVLVVVVTGEDEANVDVVSTGTAVEMVVCIGVLRSVVSKSKVVGIAVTTVVGAVTVNTISSMIVEVTTR